MWGGMWGNPGQLGLHPRGPGSQGVMSTCKGPSEGLFEKSILRNCQVILCQQKGAPEPQGARLQLASFFTSSS